MIKPWIFEFMHGVDAESAAANPALVTDVFEDSIDLWQHVEALNYEGVFFSEHHFRHSYSPSPNLLIAAIARHTTRLRLGTMGLVLPFYQPWRVVEELAMLDHLTGGRLEIGCANGVPQELARVGIGPEEARARFNEALEVLDMAIADGVVTFHGTYFDFDDLEILPRFRQQPAPPKWTTIVSTGSAKKSAGRGSKICTGFQSVETVTELFDAYRDEAAQLGVTVGPNDIGLRRNVTVARDEAEALEGAQKAKEMSLILTAGDPRIVKDGAAMLDAPKAGSGFTIHDDEFVAGTPSQVAEQLIEQCRACGAGHFLATLGRAGHANRRNMITLFGEEVVPELRRAAID